jgi:hypothetical protein
MGPTTIPGKAVKQYRLVPKPRAGRAKPPFALYY